MLKKGEVKMIHKMLKDEISKSAIARKLGINRDTVAKYAKLPEGYVPVIAIKKITPHSLPIMIFIQLYYLI